MARLLLPLLLVVGVLGAFAFSHEPAGGVPHDGPLPAEDPNCRYVGSGSCAASNCHGANGPKGTRGSEYSTWAACDPHANAYDVLFNDKSKTITKNLRHAAASTPEAEHNLLCLRCHVRPQLPEDALARDTIALDGVGCEACHGPARDWLAEHYKPGGVARAKATLGMVNTKDLAVRAGVCATCHVGQGDLDVNHDLIAAGHPRLNFELAAFHRTLPKHWFNDWHPDNRQNFEAELWAVGQVESGRAALKLLEHRAADPKKPWPEFAEYDCFACHHDLLDETWRRQPDRLKGRKPGSPEWGSWYFALADVLTEVPVQEIAELRKTMDLPGPDRAKVQESASRVAAALARARANEVTFRAVDAKAANDLRSYGWDGAAQLFLALATDNADGRRTPMLIDFRKLLQFPTGHDSPKGFDPNQLKVAPAPR